VYIFIDLDDTILDFKKAEEQALKKTLVSLDIEPSEENVQTYSIINEGLWKKLETGEMTRDQILIK
jgi:2-haloacid dehalogenase